MRILFLDLDTLRHDHLGCYGYGRNTSPNIDGIAKEGVVFDRYYCPNAPCLPSRASLISGKFGIINGVVGHGGTAADMRLEGADRSFRTEFNNRSLFWQFRRAGMYTASVSTFAERHSAWWFNAGFNECHNVGGGSMESGEKVMPAVLDWIDKNAERDNWLLHVNFWDAHTPYRAPADCGDPFVNEPLPDNWINEKVFEEHKRHIGPHGANEINMWNDIPNPKFPRHPGKLDNMADVKRFIDNYDTGIRYMDSNIGKIFDSLKEKGVFNEELAIIITSDHGENMGELGLYGEHATADEPTCHIPMIIKWPGAKAGIRDNNIHTNVDLIPTVLDMLKFPENGNRDYYDGKSYAETLKSGAECGADSAVLTQCAHVCQRSAVFGDYLYIRTYHGGGHVFEDEMLFNIMKDPHQTENIASARPALCHEGAYIIFEWQNKYMAKSPYATDPLWTVMKEGGPMHARGELTQYAERLKNAGRAGDAEKFIAKYPQCKSGF